MVLRYCGDDRARQTGNARRPSYWQPGRSDRSGRPLHLFSTITDERHPEQPHPQVILEPWAELILE